MAGSGRNYEEDREPSNDLYMDEPWDEPPPLDSNRKSPSGGGEDNPLLSCGGNPWMDDGDLPPLSRRSPLLLNGKTSTAHTKPMAPPSKAGMVAPNKPERYWSGQSTAWSDDDAPDDEQHEPSLGVRRDEPQSYISPPSQSVSSPSNYAPSSNQSTAYSSTYNSTYYSTREPEEDLMNADFCDISALGNVCGYGTTAEQEDEAIPSVPQRQLRSIMDIEMDQEPEEQTAIEVEYVAPVRKETQEKQGMSVAKKNNYLNAMARKAKMDFSNNTPKAATPRAVSPEPTATIPDDDDDDEDDGDIYSGFSATEKRKFLKMVNSGITPTQAAKSVKAEREKQQAAEATPTDSKRGLKFWKKSPKTPVSPARSAGSGPVDIDDVDEMYSSEEEMDTDTEDVIEEVPRDDLPKDEYDAPEEVKPSHAALAAGTVAAGTAAVAAGALALSPRDRRSPRSFDRPEPEGMTLDSAEVVPTKSRDISATTSPRDPIGMARSLSKSPDQDVQDEFAPSGVNYYDAVRKDNVDTAPVVQIPESYTASRVTRPTRASKQQGFAPLDEDEEDGGAVRGTQKIRSPRLPRALSPEAARRFFPSSKKPKGFEAVGDDNESDESPSQNRNMLIGATAGAAAIGGLATIATSERPRKEMSPPRSATNGIPTVDETQVSDVKNVDLIAPHASPRNHKFEVENPMDIDLDKYITSSNNYAAAKDEMSVVSGKSHWTAQTGTSAVTTSSRKRRPGAAKTRLAKAKQAEKVTANKTGWHESMRTAAASSKQYWDPKKGFAGYQDPDGEILVGERVDETIHVNLNKALAKSRVAEEEAASQRNLNKSAVKVPFPSDWETERDNMLKENGVILEHEAPPVPAPIPRVSLPTRSMEELADALGKQEDELCDVFEEEQESESDVSAQRALPVQSTTEDRHSTPAPDPDGVAPSVAAAAAVGGATAVGAVAAFYTSRQSHPPPSIDDAFRTAEPHSPQEIPAEPSGVSATESNTSSPRGEKYVQIGDTGSVRSYPYHQSPSDAAKARSVRSSMNDNSMGLRDLREQSDDDTPLNSSDGFDRTEQQAQVNVVKEKHNEDDVDLFAHDSRNRYPKITSDTSVASSRRGLGPVDVDEIDDMDFDDSDEEEWASRAIAPGNIAAGAAATAVAPALMPKLRPPPEKTRSSSAPRGSSASRTLTPRSAQSTPRTSRSPSSGSTPKLLAPANDTSPIRERKKVVEAAKAKEASRKKQRATSNDASRLALEIPSMERLPTQGDRAIPIGTTNNASRRSVESPSAKHLPQQETRTIPVGTTNNASRRSVESPSAKQLPQQEARTIPVGTTNGNSSRLVLGAKRLSVEIPDNRVDMPRESPGSSSKSVKSLAQQWEHRAQASSPLSSPLSSPVNQYYNTRRDREVDLSDQAIAWPEDGDVVEDDRASTSNWKSFLGKKVKAENAAAYAGQERGHENARPDPIEANLRPEPDGLRGESIDDYDDFSDVSPIPDADEDDFMEAVSDSGTNIEQSSFMRRLQACATPMMPRQFTQGGSENSMPSSHLAFLRANPPAATEGAADQQISAPANTRYVPPAMCGRPDVIVEESDEASANGTQRKAFPNYTEPAPKASKTPSSRPRSSQRSGGRSISSGRSVASDDGFGARTSYLESVAMKAAVTDTKRPKSRGRGSDDKSRCSVVSEASSTTSRRTSEKWQEFIDRKAADSRVRSPNSSAGVSETNAAERVEQMMEAMSKHSRPERKAKVEADNGKVEQMMEAMSKQKRPERKTQVEVGPVSPPSDSELRSPYEISRGVRSRSDGSKSTTRSVTRKHESARAAEELAAARVEAMMAAMNSTTLDEGEI